MLSSWFATTKDTVDNENVSSSTDNTSLIPYLTNLLYANQFVSYYKTDTRDFVNEISTANCQRCIDNVHVEQLSIAIKKSKHCVGTFKVVCLNDENPELIDGQHRVMALKKIMDEDAHFNMDLILEVYTVNNKVEKRELFKQANNVKNIEEFDLPDEVYSEVVDKVIIKLKNNFKYSNGKECIKTPKIVDKAILHRPDIDVQVLTKLLVEHTKNKNLKDIDNIYDKICKINAKYGMKKRTEFKPTVNEPTYKRAKDCGFYLGLEKNMSIWVKEL